MGERSNSKAVFVIQCRLAMHANHVKDHIFHNLYPLICRREWLEKALNAVLDNKGSKTAGVDGTTKRSLFETDEARAKFLDELQRELKTGNYHPCPVLRKWIPKRKKGEQRPIGIPTLADRVAQMLLKMVLEPIFECDFLCNSNGFRLGRSTLECVLPLYQYGNRETNYNWVIEGDIQSCFDNIDHETLMKSVQKRIGDRKVLRLMWRFLRAPVKEKECKLARKTEKGVPQGGILSPLLANIALNEFDKYWFERWGNLDFHQRERRLKRGQANCVLFRYADDFILSAKGTKEAVECIMREITQFFADKLKLNLSKEKTRVVSIDEEFKFLGFQISRERLAGFRSVRIRPTQENVIRLKTKLQEMLGKKSDRDDPVMKVIELNRVLQGWSGYFYKVNSSKQFQALDYFARKLFLQWYCRSRKMSIRRAMSRIQHKGKIVIAREGDAVQLVCMSEERLSQHTALKHDEVWKYRHIDNPYLLSPQGINETNSVTESDDPMKVAEAVRNIHPIDKAYGEIYLCNRIVAMRRDGFRCRKCGSRGNLATHHIIPVTRRGKLNTAALHGADNLTTLCKDCHIDLHSSKGNTSVLSAR